MKTEQRIEEYLTEANEEKNVKRILDKNGYNVKSINVRKVVTIKLKKGLDVNDLKNWKRIDAIEAFLKKEYGKDALVSNDFDEFIVEV